MNLIEFNKICSEKNPSTIIFNTLNMESMYLGSSIGACFEFSTIVVDTVLRYIILKCDNGNYLILKSVTDVYKKMTSAIGDVYDVVCENDITEESDTYTIIVR